MLGDCENPFLPGASRIADGPRSIPRRRCLCNARARARARKLRLIIDLAAAVRNYESVSRRIFVRSLAGEQALIPSLISTIP